MTRTTDSQGRPVVAVTGMGLVTPLAQGCEASWKMMMAGKSGVRPISRFPVEGLRSKVAGTVERVDFSDETRTLSFELDDLDSLARSCWIGEAAGREAGVQAGLGNITSGRGRDHDFPGPLFVACAPSELEWPLLQSVQKGATEPTSLKALCDIARMVPGDFIDDEYNFLLNNGIPNVLANNIFGTTGLPISVCTACASGATAIGLGVEAIRRGEKAALVIATDASVHQEAMVRFSLLSAVSTHNEPPEAASRPFDKTRAGFVIAEGAAALVLEDYDAAKARGAKILGVVRGYGERADTFHRTRSMPDGSGMIGAIENTLQDAGVSPDEVDHVNAHGTSTPENDKMESLSLNAVFGERIMDVPVASNKGQLGHCLLAAGAVEAVISLLTIQNGIIPANMNYHTPDPNINLDIVANTPRKKDVNIVLSNSFGFGGQNACLVFSSGEEYE